MYADKDNITRLVKRNWRGVQLADLVFFILEHQSRLEHFTEDAIDWPYPSDCPKEEWLELHRHECQAELADAQNELECRRTINETYVKSSDREVIQVIKERLPVENVIEWYTNVIYNGHNSWKFKCTLHGDGQDKDASGVIYPKESRWWCFGCNKGGDVFDAVQAFERVDLPTAIRKLATNLGIELRPLKPIPRPAITGVREL